MIKILIVDDLKTSREVLKSFLELESDFEIVDLAGDGKEAIQKVEQYDPDVVIMDINMPVMDGLSATRIITERFRDTKTIIFSSYDDDDSLSNAIETGAKGYVFKSTPPQEMVTAVRSVYQGYFQLGPGLLERYLYRFSISSSSSKEIQSKLVEIAYEMDKNNHLNFVVNRLRGEIDQLQKNYGIMRSLVILLAVLNGFVFFILLIFQT